jgi:L-lactate dehydrogenase complex protein LldG
MRFLPHHQGWVKWLPSVGSAGSASRDFPPFAVKPFHERMKSCVSAQYPAPKLLKLAGNITPSDPIPAQPSAAQPLLERFKKEWQNLGGEFFSASSRELPEVVLAWLKEQGVREMLAWREAASEDTVLRETLLLLKRAGITLREPFRHPAGEEYTLDAGLSGASCALADSGTLVVPGGGGRMLQTSLMAPIHLAVLNAAHIHATMSEWLSEEGSELVIKSPNTVLISGPSRTADIEMTLTIGMHGPERAVIFCYT